MNGPCALSEAKEKSHGRDIPVQIVTTMGNPSNVHTRRYAYRNGRMVDITGEKETRTFHGRIKCDPPWTTGFKG